MRHHQEQELQPHEGLVEVQHLLDGHTSNIGLKGMPFVGMATIPSYNLNSSTLL